MKAGVFFELTRKTRTAQKLYYKTRLQGDLITAKQLESELDKALLAGKVEPDEQKPAAERLSEQQYKEYLRLLNANQIELMLADGQGENGQ
jgi:hypothetical protein